MLRILNYEYGVMHFKEPRELTSQTKEDNGNNEGKNE